jgi:hypothetical protein
MLDSVISNFILLKYILITSHRMAPYMDIRPNEGLCTEFADAMRKWERNFVCNLEDKVLSAFSTDMGIHHTTRGIFETTANESTQGMSLMKYLLSMEISVFQRPLALDFIRRNSEMQRELSKPIE